MEKNMPGCNLEFVREDDYVEYFIFPQLADNLTDATKLNEDELKELRDHLNLMLEKCLKIVEQKVKELNFIWHKDHFQLRPRAGDAQERLLNDEVTSTTRDAVPLPPHLHGVTHFSDNIEDEWFIVYLLSEITRNISGSIARVIDSDGEFLMIEAADYLPKWANPDTCEQRVYLYNGVLQLVQNSPSNTKKILPIASAISKIHLNPTLYRVSKEVQECINARFKDFKPPYPSLHRQIVNLPLGVAALLKEQPSLIASAVRAFCERDPIDMKACRSMRFFPPEQRVRTNVCFTRCLYAMIMHSNYTPDRKIGWNLGSATNTERYKEDLLGVKIASGFEILATQAKDTKSMENDPAWRAYLKSLTAKGYFRGNLEGSVEYQRLLAEARTYFDSNAKRFRTMPVVGGEILELLRSIEVNADQLADEENNLQPSDSDDWLNISAEQLDAMLMERYGPKTLYKPNGDIDAAAFTKNIAEFLEKQSVFEGIGSDSDDADDDDDEDMPGTSAKAAVKKNKSMRRACRQGEIQNQNSQSNKSQTATGDDSEQDGVSTHVRSFLDFVIPEDKWDSNSEMSDYEDEDDLEQNINAMTNSEKNIDFNIKEYMAQMDKELARTTIGETFKGSGVNKSKSATADDDFDDIESFEPIDINVNTLKNMMDSYKSQIGGPGPVSQLLNAMGIGMSAATDELQNKDLSESTV